jgi:ferritin-like metal-binding protein YciE
MPQLEELLTEDLRDIYDAEKQAVKAYPRLARFASSQELKQAMNQHLEQTKNQVTRVEQCFELLGEKAKSKPCRAMKGLVEEAMEHAQEHEKGPQLDSVLIGSLQKVEHYEIAAYGTARAMAKSAGHREAANLLNETLKEEGETDKLLTKIALGIQKQIVQEAGMDTSGAEEEESHARGRRGSSAQSSGNRGMGSKKKVDGQRSGSQASANRRASGSNGSSGRGGTKQLAGRSGGTKVTTDHDEIREWAQERGAHPACVRGTGGKGDTGMIRLDFPGYSGADSLQEITWDDFFQKFDEQGLALLYQESTTRGQKSNFNKLIARETAELAAQGGRGSARRGTGRR